jgi:hypothetical protein
VVVAAGEVDVVDADDDDRATDEGVVESEKRWQP